jgi:D-alanyl-D-alanine carboxypeptidase
MVPAVLDRIFAAVLLAVHGAPAPDTSVLARAAPPALSYPAEVSGGPFSPGLTAQAYLSVNLKNGAVVFAKQPHQQRPIASLTKIMTGVLAAEHGDLEQRIRGTAVRARPAARFGADDLGQRRGLHARI